MPYQSGNSIKLNVLFKDFAGAPVDPSLIKLKIYDNNMVKIDEVSIGAEHKLAVGSYFYIYTIPYPEQNNDPLSTFRYYYEWYAEISNTVSLKRTPLEVSFV